MTSVFTTPRDVEVEFLGYWLVHSCTLGLPSNSLTIYESIIELGFGGDVTSGDWKFPRVIELSRI